MAKRWSGWTGRAVALKEVLGENTNVDIEYYWIPETWSEQRLCPKDVNGCADADLVYTESVPHEHELVHALRRERLPAVFEEGLAELFSEIGWVRKPASRERLITMLEKSEIVDLADYSRASHFVAFLVETYGLDPLFRLAELASYHDDYSRVRNAFARAYGFSLDQALAEYEDFPECDPLEWMDKRIACAEPGVPLDPRYAIDVRFAMNLDCSEPEVYGPFADFMFTETTLEIDSYVDFPTWISLIGDIGPDVSAALVSCEGGCGGSTSVWVSTETPTQLLELPAGRYVLRLFRPVDDPGELGIALRL